MSEDNPFDAKEIRPFIEAADRKGLLLSFDAGESKHSLALWQIEMDLVRVSLENAITRARGSQIDGLAERLERLLRHGTGPQQVDFVLGSQRVYYFPEDIEKMVNSGPNAAHHFALRPFSWLRCKPMDDGSQHCEEHHNEVCLVF